jgi:opacity protein-like surface antigen
MVRGEDQMSLKKALLAATVLALPVAAQAQPITGFYVGAGAGINLRQETDITVSGPLASGLTAAQRSGSVEFEYGWVGAVSLGYGFGNGVRVELEGNYRENEVDSVSGFRGFAPAQSRADGKTRTYGVMANALYDFDLGPASFVMPYIGVGAGYAWTEFDSVRVRNGATPVFTADGDDGRFAYQAILGAAFPLTSVAPGLALTAEYRFFGTLDADIDVVGTGAARTRGTAEVENYNHSLMVGIRYAFGATPAAAGRGTRPGPGRGPCPGPYLPGLLRLRPCGPDRPRPPDHRRGRDQRPARRHDPDRGLRPRRPLRHAAVQPAPVRAPGPGRRRRARASWRRPLRHGHPGLRREPPLVPTADGVREPQNRRVEIVLR